MMLGRSAASGDIEVLVLCQEVAVRSGRRPRLNPRTLVEANASTYGANEKKKRNEK
jgi:hypothetical protein